ncbi:hypothetical protein [Streptomyces sp. NPDC058989]|uniref:hypothetical protein n=1 Tax=Streptomyces sp. NPDC058989 TaxID=3346686 RepID=UPI003698AC3B
MRIRTTLFAVTLATAALLGGAGTAAADANPDYSTPRSAAGADVSDAPMGKDVVVSGREGGRGSDGASDRKMEDDSPGGLVGRLTGGM